MAGRGVADHKADDMLRQDEMGPGATVILGNTLKICGQSCYCIFEVASGVAINLMLLRMEYGFGGIWSHLRVAAIVGLPSGFTELLVYRCN
jgi:hypothetical protein